MTIDKVSTGLLEDVVIYTEAQTGDTGAQSVAPGHLARHPYHPQQLPAKPNPSTAVGTLQNRVEQFIFYQSELLDSKQWQAYIDLFAEDGVYWMPVMQEQTEWLDSPSIFAEDKGLMEVRMGRLTHPNAWSQAPTWGTSHIVSNVVIEAQNEASVSTRSRFQMLELHRDVTRHFGGTYRHILARVGDDFAIKLQRVDLLNGQAIFDYVLQAWV